MLNTVSMDLYSTSWSPSRIAHKGICNRNETLPSPCLPNWEDVQATLLYSIPFRLPSSLLLTRLRRLYHKSRTVLSWDWLHSHRCSKMYILCRRIIWERLAGQAVGGLVIKLIIIPMAFIATRIYSMALLLMLSKVSVALVGILKDSFSFLISKSVSL